MNGKPFALIGVNSDDLPRAKKAVEENKLNWRSFQNEHEGREVSIASDWFVSGWPTIVVLDAEMKVRYRGHDGHAASDVAKKLVEELDAAKK
jgi:hypothetical protein